MAVKTIRIYLVAIAATLPAISIGICFSWSSPIGPKLMSLNSTDTPLSRPITAIENGWISSIFSIGALTTSILNGPWIDIIGRKKIILFSSVFFISGYIFLIIGKEVWFLLAGRLILGFGTGFAISAMPLYVADISTDQTRGASVALMPMFMSFGCLLGFCIGPYASYRMLQYFCLLLPIISDAIFIFMPESPYYYVRRGQRVAAAKVMQFLRGKEAQDVESELVVIENLLKSCMVEKVGLLEIVKTPNNRRALFITLGVTLFQQLSGIGVVNFYAQIIFENANTNIDAAISTIIAGFVQFIAGVTAPFVISRFGRKTILLYSTAFLSISQAVLGYTFFAKIVLQNTAGITLLPLASILLLNIAFNIGIGPVTWTLISEMFPQNTKSFATALNITLGGITAFLLALLFPFIQVYGTYYAFWLYASFCALAFFFILFFVIETKNLSLADIQKKLHGTL